MANTGTLFVVGIPIGNIEDISHRAVRILDTVPLVACEDIGRTKRLLGELNIGLHAKRLVKLFDRNETERTSKLTQVMLEGNDVALISDAGTPLISDPGFKLIRMTRRHSINVVPIPGPSALSTALSVSPIPVNDFRFVGFLKTRRSELRNQIEMLIGSTSTLVFFESRHRILSTLQAIASFGAGSRPLFIARELTKHFEETISGTVDSVIDELARREEVLGELVCILSGVETGTERGDIDETLHAFRNENIKPTTVARIVARLTGANRNEVYERILAGSHGENGV